MRIKMGLWIDHRKAIIVGLTAKGEEVGLIVSRVEKHLQRSGDSPLKGRYESQKVPGDGSRQRRLTRQLDIFYDAVIACVRNAETVLIFGPGEAKGEFRKRIMKAGIRGHIEEAETVDKMTDRQIAAKVREYFAE